MMMLRSNATWLSQLRRYLIWSAGLHLAWEALQLPLYTLWYTGTTREFAFALVHCSAGDVMIAALALLAALLLVGEAGWPQLGAPRVAVLMLSFGIGYTIFSEWLNTVVRQSWAYAPLMPTLPWIGTGLSPLLQWVIVPLLALRFANDVDGRRSPR